MCGLKPVPAPGPNRRNVILPQSGFTLAELLIALAILGLIAVFTIPKILLAQQHQEWNAKAKETFSMLAGAFEAYKSQNTLTPATRLGDLTPYMNYASVDTSAHQIDHVYGNGTNSASCNQSGWICLRLHHGGIAMVAPDLYFGESNSTNYVWFLFDPDGTFSGSPTGSGKSVVVMLYYNGRLVSGDQRGATDAVWAGGSPVVYGGPDGPSDWFSWD